ncbi:MAG: CTP-dependent riboflavin kinase [Candidatus Bathyarchaeota archaeon]|nr:CTP-dependent riboflavin kinase [Candidatus Bathyarchaeota archaeon]MDH5787013.1 CTP-dependent riboflavin kinase [Candidatus Bathyarchaeota archaeon]
MNSSYPKELCIIGKVFSGKSEGKAFITFPWVRKQIIEKLGFIPYPGTLNIELAGDDVKLKKLLVMAKPTEISPVTGFCRGKCFKAHLMDNVKCAIIIPEITDYPENVLEIIASVNLREKLLLKNGDTVKVKLTLQ